MTNLERYVGVDKNNLDEECARLSQDYDDWCKEENLAIDIRDRLKTLLDQSKAEAELEIRSTPASELTALVARWGKAIVIDGLKEATVKALVLIHPGVVKAQEDFLKSQSTVRSYTRTRKSLEMKKRMLSDLTNQFGVGYFCRTAEAAPFRDFKQQYLEKQSKRQMAKSRAAKKTPKKITRNK